MGKQAEGVIKDVVGQAQDVAGVLTGDLTMQAAGKGKQLAGKAQQTLGQATEQISDIVRDRPLLVLGAVAAISFVFGRLHSDR